MVQARSVVPTRSFAWRARFGHQHRFARPLKGAPRGVADVKDFDPVGLHTVEDPEWITDHRRSSNIRALQNAWRGLGRDRNSRDHIFNALSDRSGNKRTSFGSVILGDPLEIPDGLPRIDQFHCRKRTKASLTSSSEACSPWSSEAIAASTTRNSSALARYSFAFNSVSICSAIETSSSRAASGQLSARSITAFRSERIV